MEIASKQAANWSTITMTKPRVKSAGSRDTIRREAHAAAGVGAGALSGAAIGAIGGPVGALAGAVIGGVVGAVGVGVAETNAADLASLESDLEVDGSSADTAARPRRNEE